MADNSCKEKRGLFLSDGKVVIRESSSSTFVITSSSLPDISPPDISVLISPTATFNPSRSLVTLTSLAVSSSFSTASASSSLTPVSPSATAKTFNQIGTIAGSAVGAAADAALIIRIIFLIRMRHIKHQQSLNNEIQQARGVKNNFMKGDVIHPELAVNGPKPELEDPERSRRQVPELEELRRPVPELEDLTRS